MLAEPNAIGSGGMTMIDEEAATDAVGERRRRLILCLDGTWNTPDGKTITSIVRLRDIVQPGLVPFDGVEEIDQRIYYDEGVGTTGRIRRWIAGATGIGLSCNVRQAYRYLSANYRPGDQILIFGFSRGAFTARSLAGYIGASGLLKPEHCNSEAEQRSWNYYRTSPKDRYPSEGRALAAVSFPPVRISALGVFDTVGALGIPGMLRSLTAQRYQFHDTTLGSNIEVALHALAADEKRYSFAPALWQMPSHKGYGSVEQVWFPGVHSDVGGDYAEDGVGRIVLEWMLKRIRALGAVHGIDVKLRPAATRIHTDREAPLHESRTPLFVWDHVRPSIRVMAQQRPVKRWRERMSSLAPHARPIGEYIHASLLSRMDKESDGRRVNITTALKALAGGTAAPLGFVDWNGRPYRWGRNPDNETKDRQEFYQVIPAHLHSGLDAFLKARWQRNLCEPDPHSPFW